MSTTSTFHPPYLRYEIPTDMLQIQKNINALKKASLFKQPIKKSDIKITEISKGTLHITDTNIIQELSSQKQIAKGVSISKASKSSPNPNTNNVTKSILAVSTISIDVTPNGNVPLGFNCKKTFIASNNFGADTCYWNLRFKNLATGNFDIVKYLGGTSTPGPSDHSITFDLDFDTYNQAAYVANNGLAIFKIECQGWNWGVVGPWTNSPEITLNFNADPCIALNSLSLNTDSITGGDNGTDPVLTVNIDAPAPPGGLKINLKVSNSNLGNIMGDGFFYIDAGQTSGSISWFLGTRRVYSTGKSFNIIVTIEGSSAEGYALVNLTKQ